MTEYLIEYLLEGSSDRRQARISARSEAEARKYLKEEKGQKIIINSTRKA